MSDSSAPTVDEVRDALMEVVDPEIGLPIVELGLVYDIAVAEDGDVAITYTLTSMGCPAGSAIDGGIHDAVSNLDGVGECKTTIVFQPPWSPEKMSDDAKVALGFV